LVIISGIEEENNGLTSEWWVVSKLFDRWHTF